MDIRELILTRRTVHNYTPEKVPDELVREALELSLWAPNHMLTFPWVYHWIGPKCRAALAELNAELKGGRDSVKGQAAQNNVLNPSHLVSLGIKRSRDTPMRQHEDYATLACSVQSMSLFLWHHGVCTKWTTGGWSTHERAYGILGVSAAEVQLEGCLLIGKAQTVPPAPPRPAFDRHVRRTT